MISKWLETIFFISDSKLLLHTTIEVLGVLLIKLVSPGLFKATKSLVMRVILFMKNNFNFFSTEWALYSVDKRQFLLLFHNQVLLSADRGEFQLLTHKFISFMLLITNSFDYFSTIHSFILLSKVSLNYLSTRLFLKLYKDRTTSIIFSCTSLWIYSWITFLFRPIVFA